MSKETYSGNILSTIPKPFPSCHLGGQNGTKRRKHTFINTNPTPSLPIQLSTPDSLFFSLSLSPLHVSPPQLLLLRPLIPNPYLRPRFPLPQSRSPVMARRVLVTGGAGYIGSHTVLQLLLEGFSVVVVDNLDNSSVVAVQRVAQLAGEFGKNLAFHRVIVVYCCVTRGGDWFDIRDKEALEKVFATSKFLYQYLQLMIEEICRDIHHADGDWKIMLLRYFNPVGAHPSGQIGEDPCGIPNNLMPLVQQVAVGRRPTLAVFGNDYPTKDGTGVLLVIAVSLLMVITKRLQVRDYIHVVDLADGHIAALQKFFEDPNIGIITDQRPDTAGCEVYNLGTGKGTSVLEMVAVFEKASGKVLHPDLDYFQKIPLVMAGRRPGDAETLYACTVKAEKELSWKYSLISCMDVEMMANAEQSMASKRCAAINGTGLPRTPGDTDRPTLLTEEALQIVTPVLQ
ncbi:hypothetical protein BHM03_00018826 [Ensete ventricosum]|nr:hypothetical protein BHM03_00018826 [Ensete ventricosum]